MELEKRIAALEAQCELQGKQIVGLLGLLETRHGEILAAHAAIGVLLTALPDRARAARDLNAAFDEFVGTFMALPSTSEEMLDGFRTQETRLRRKLSSGA